MKRRARHRLCRLGSSCLIALASFACTHLQDPNQTFGDLRVPGSSTAGGGTAGELGVSRGGSAGLNGSVQTTAGNAGNAGTAGQRALGGSGGDSGAPDTDCVDETGLHGLGCYRCAPTDISTLENACTTATCTGFDDTSRLALLGKDGKLPALPLVGSGGAGGATGSAGAGGSTGGSGGAPGTGRA